MFDYGILWINGGHYLAHRLALELHLKRNLLKPEVRHVCDNPPCCNPYHLLEGNHRENMRDMFSRNRRTCEKGEERYNSKLTEEKVREIRSLFEKHQKYKPMTKTKLSKMFGVDRALIHKIILRKAWRHVE